MAELALTRAIHVIAVLHWIGGLAFVTWVVLPLAAARPDAAEGLALFLSVERRFSAQVRVSVPVVGVSGFWMVWRLDVWDRFADPAFWWMTAMVSLWLIFMLLLFVLEPLLHSRFENVARRDPAAALRMMRRMHAILLALSGVTVAGAVAGAHGLYFG